MDTQTHLRDFQKGFKNHGIIMITLLIIQYILGMVSNLFVAFPQSGLEVQMWEFARAQFPVISHVVLGLLLLVNAIVFVIRALSKRNRIWITASLVGLVAITTAIYSGATFIPSQADQYSFIMALSFIIALIVYGWGLYASKS